VSKNIAYTREVSNERLYVQYFTYRKTATSTIIVVVTHDDYFISLQ